MLMEKLEARRLPQMMILDNGHAVRTPDDWRIRRRELIDLLSREEYGYTPEAPERVTGAIRPAPDQEMNRAFAGKAVQQTIDLSFDTPGGVFSFPVILCVPRSAAKAPVFVYIAFRRDFPDRYLPVEEILDHGFAIAAFCYEDVTADSACMNRLAALYPRDEKNGWGKIGMWAFAASRVLDYLETRDDIDLTRACVSGHSRLGKTALWCGAQDERFSMVISNDSGCCGAALSRGKIGETVARINAVFPYWFCGNHLKWSGREGEMPFDQHMLLALTAPRRLYVCSAEEDSWADPESEFLSCLAASEAWQLHRLAGLVTPDALPVPGSPLLDGGVCYHLRTGAHFHSRTDWGYHMACRERFRI